MAPATERRAPILLFSAFFLSSFFTSLSSTRALPPLCVREQVSTATISDTRCVSVSSLFFSLGCSSFRDYTAAIPFFFFRRARISAVFSRSQGEISLRYALLLPGTRHAAISSVVSKEHARREETSAFALHGGVDDSKLGRRSAAALLPLAATARYRTEQQLCCCRTVVITVTLRAASVVPGMFSLLPTTLSDLSSWCRRGASYPLCRERYPGERRCACVSSLAGPDGPSADGYAAATRTVKHGLRATTKEESRRLRRLLRSRASLRRCHVTRAPIGRTFSLAH